MATVTLRPNAVAATTNTPTIVGGSASHNAAQADDADATYTELSGGSIGESVSLDFTTVAVPALAQIRSVRPAVRVATTSNTIVFGEWEFRAYVIIGGVTYLSPANAPTATAALTNFNGSVLTTNPRNGGVWTQADIDAVGVREFWFANSRIHRFYEAWVDVVYNEAPVATVTAPTGTVSTSTRPLTTWTYSDPENDTQERYRVKVFSAAQYGAGGFNPETSAATWDSGEVMSSGTSAAMTTDLANNTTYKSYVKVADAGSSGRYGNWAAGPAFTITLDPPAVPTITATVDPTLARVILALQGRDNMLTFNQSSLETDATGWANRTNATVARSTAQASHGTGSLSMTSVAAGSMAAQTPGGTSGFAVSAGQTYVAAAKFRAATVARSCRVDVAFFNAAGAEIATTTGATVTTTTTGFTEATVTATAPTGAATAQVVLHVLSTAAAGEVHYADQIAHAPAVGTYVWTRGGYTETAANQRVAVERSVDGGAKWVTLRGASAVDLADPAQSATVYDYDGPLGVPVSYRARTSGLVSGLTLASANSASATATPAAVEGVTWLKSPSDPTKSITFIHEDTRFASVSTEPQGIFYADGRPDPIVIAGTVRAEVFGALRLFFANDAEWEAFEVLRKRAEPVLFQTCFGEGTPEQYWLRLGPDREVVRLTTDDMRVTQRRRVTVGAHEVRAPV